MYQSRPLSIVLLAAYFSRAATAGAIERDWLDANDRLITFDIVNQREWLDLNVTQGESVAGARTELLPGGRYAGFVHAQTEDVLDFATSAGVNLDCNPDDFANDEFIGFQTLIGVTQLGAFMFMDSTGVSLSSEKSKYEQTAFSSFIDGLDGSCMHASVDEYSEDPSIPDDNHGIWLYRSVPEPSGLETMMPVVMIAVTLSTRLGRKSSRLVRSSAIRSISSNVLPCACVILILAFTSRAALAQGEVINVEITSQALEGNAIGDPATRSSRVYLPPGYDENSTRRYPVVYYLHGGAGDEHTLFSNWRAHRTADRLIDAGTMEEMILVTVNARTSYAGTNYFNSKLLGAAEDYIVQDVVNYIDENYRTIADRDSRGLIGASSGGNAALRYAMLHADVFGAVSTLSSGMFDFSHPNGYLYLGGDKAAFAQVILDAARVSDPDEILAAVKDWTDVGDTTAEGHSLIRLVYSMAGSISSNLDSPTWADLPFEVPGLEIIPEIRDQWYEFDLHRLLPQHVDALASLRGFSMDSGDNEIALVGNQSFHQALLDVGVDHEFEVFSGDHRDQRAQRVEEALKYLSERLVVSRLDFDKDGDIALGDIDTLCAGIAVGRIHAGFDLNLDDEINSLDVAFFLDEHGTQAGDTNLDGEIEFDDFLTLSSNFGKSISPPWSNGDFDCSGEIDFTDFLLLSENYGKTSAVAMANVPEPRPSTLILCGSLLTSFARRRHRRNQRSRSCQIAMPTVTLSAVATIGILTAHNIQVAHGGIVERDWKHPGDGLLTFDDINHREWLDLTETQGQSITDVTSHLAATGNYAGFVHATVQDVFRFAESAGIRIDLNVWALDPALVRDFQQHVGITDTGSFLWVWSSGIAVGERGSDSMFAEVQFILSDIGDPPQATLSHHSWNVDPELALRPYGMWMYRPACDPKSEGDFNGDGNVNFTDFLVLSANFNGAATSHIQGDIDCNGMVDFADFLMLAQNFRKGEGAQTSTTVPEPSGLEMVGLTGLMGCLARWNWS